MKRYSSTTKGSSRRSTIKLWYRGALVTVVFALIGWLMPNVLSFVSYVVLLPVQQVNEWYQYSEDAVPKYLRSRENLVKENESLRQQLANQAGTQLSVQRLLYENMQLRTLLTMATSSPRIAARVIAQPSRLNYDLLQINQGSQAGVTVGAPVFVGLDSVVGVVVHVAPTYAFVDLVTTPGFLASAYVVGPNTFAQLEGVGGGVARVRVPQGILLALGNLVLLPSVSGGIYGEIVAIENIPTQPEQYGYVTPAVPLQSLLYVSVGQSSPTPKSQAEIDTLVRTQVRDYFRIDAELVWSLVGTTTSPVSTTTATSGVTSSVVTP